MLSFACDDFSIKSDEPPDPIDDLLDDSGSESGSENRQKTKTCLNHSANTKKPTTDHDYVRDDDTDDETCSEYEDLFVSDHEDRS